MGPKCKEPKCSEPKWDIKYELKKILDLGAYSQNFLKNELAKVIKIIRNVFHKIFLSTF